MSHERSAEKQPPFTFFLKEDDSQYAFGSNYCAPMEKEH